MAAVASPHPHPHPHRGHRGPPEVLSVHELAGPEVLQEPGYQAAISTPPCDPVAAPAPRRERREPGPRNPIGA